MGDVARPSRRRIGVLAALGLVALGVLVGVVVLEGVARVLWVDPLVAWSAKKTLPGLPPVNGQSELTLPNRVAQFHGVEHRTNSFGFRGREYTQVPGEDVFRIVLIGDSVAMGQRVPEADIYSSVLEESLNAGASSRRAEVLNLAVSGYSIHDSVQRLTTLGLRLKPDLVVYGYTTNDILGPAYRRSFKRFAFDRQRRRMERFAQSRSYVLRLAWPRIQSLIELRSPPKGSHLFEEFDNYFNNEPAWRGFVRGFDRLADIQTSVGVPVVVFLHTRLFYLNLFHPYRRIYDKVADAAESRGLLVVRSLDEFRGHNGRSLWAGDADPHPNPTGHAILARALEKGLRRQGLLD